ncbi:hypothetical protein [Shewanella oncorhynchi]|uniref:hypothetical protein n=1 Tax=Shewanella oncorhynchi TaxID=2726434 RepID=UPI003D79EA9C
MKYDIKPKYTDQFLNEHLSGEKLGDGGQGVVFRTNDPDLAIKLSAKDGQLIEDKVQIEELQSSFKKLRIFPLDGVKIAIPLVVLKDAPGYVMQVMSDMVPFSSFLFGEQKMGLVESYTIPKWLGGCDKRYAQEITHYLNSGGLRKRLNALYKCASILCQIHGRGIVYGDINPNNEFVSEDIGMSEVWLIDADNLRFETANGGLRIYFPRFGAPEIVQGKAGASTQGDCHAFAVLAYLILTNLHPFVGDLVLNNDDWAVEIDEGESLENMAYAGKLPWIDDREDDSNHRENGGLRGVLTLTPKLENLFQATFGPGRTSPMVRPAIYHWPEALAQAADMTVTCPGCSMNYYFDFIHPETDEHNCPYCKTQRPQVLILESYRWNGADKPLQSPSWQYVREISQGTELTIPRRVFDELVMIDSDIAEVLISSSNNGILIKKSDNGKADLSVAADSHPQSGFQKLYSQMKIDRVSPDIQFWMFAHLNSPRLVKCMISGGGK